jgi:hypothetical protein
MRSVAGASVHNPATSQHAVSCTHVADAKRAPSKEFPGSAPWRCCWLLMRELSMRTGGRYRLCDHITPSSNQGTLSVTFGTMMDRKTWRRQNGPIFNSGAEKAALVSDSTTQGLPSSVGNTRSSPLPHIKCQRRAIVTASASDTTPFFILLLQLLLLTPI